MTIKNKEQIKVLVKVTHEQAMKICDKFEKTDDLFMITEWGAVGKQEEAKYVLELGEKTDDNWFGDISFLENSEDGVFVRIKKEDNKTKLPNFEDVFEMRVL